ncbi:S24 family peptidase [Sphingomonas paeninsulae]|nr:S24 family peptidase [Sphingomonas paeninsulae]
MSERKTVGQVLLDLKARTTMSLDDIAKGGDYKGKSSVQEYFKDTYDTPLGRKAADRFAKALRGKGAPPILEEEIEALVSHRPPSNAKTVKYEGSSLSRMNDDLPVYGSAMGADTIVDGEAIELTRLNTADIIEYRERPQILNGKRDVYGLYVQGNSMDPAFDDGDLLVVQKTSSISARDFVVVYLRPTDDTDDGETARHVLIKRLVRRTSQFVELQQYEPKLTFRIAMNDVLRIDKALRMSDVLASAA